MASNQPQFLSFSSETLLPQEERLEIGRKKKDLFIGIPKETEYMEKRIALAPDAVDVLVRNGHQVRVESGAGTDASFSDQDYSDAGAEICYEPKKIFEAQTILKVHPPTLKEIELLHSKQTLISALQLKIQDERYFKALMGKNVSAIAFDYMMDDDGIMPVVRSMSEIAGNTAILIAAELMSNANNGKGLMLGGVSGVGPTDVVILGAGTVGEFACRAAIGLGAQVKVFDKSLTRLRRLQNDIHQRIATSVVQPKVLEKALKRADVVIGAIRADEGRTPSIVTEEMVQQMKAGSVIVDVSIDHGGCFETSEITTHEHPTFRKFEVIHYGVPNIASRVARTASLSLSNIFMPILLNAGDQGGIDAMVRFNKGLRHGLYMYNGVLTNKGIGEWYKLPWKNLDLLLAAL
ncbi:alanine dehydrogenase [Cryomorphaceae bacterium]|nr:alanine dehydrogenase [Cryomorphaceae bacterium]